MSGLQVHGNGIVHACLNALCGEPVPPAVSTRRANRKHVVHVADVRAFGRQPHRRSGERASVLGRAVAARLRPPLEMRQFHPEDGALYSVHPVVEAFDGVLVAALLAPAAQRSDAPGHLRVARHDSPTLAVCAEILSGIEAETGHRAHRAAAAPAILGTVCLRSVLDHREAPPLRDLENRIHVGRLAVQVHGDDRLRPGCDRRLEP
jgi:hypothetical protein